MQTIKSKSVSRAYRSSADRVSQSTPIIISSRFNRRMMVFSLGKAFDVHNKLGHGDKATSTTGEQTNHQRLQLLKELFKSNETEQTYSTYSGYPRTHFPSCATDGRRRHLRDRPSGASAPSSRHSGASHFRQCHEFSSNSKRRRPRKNGGRLARRSAIDWTKRSRAPESPSSVTYSARTLTLGG